MNVLILGIDPANRGAGLMYETVREQLAAKYPRVRVALPASTNPAERLKLGAWATPLRDKNSSGKLLYWLANTVPSNVVTRMGVIAEKDIQVVLDASGFAYGEFWGPDKLKNRLAGRIEAWRRSGKKVIALPQAWGSFENKGFQPLLKTVLKHANLVFARDGTSLGYLKAEVGDAPNLLPSPDFTNLLKAGVPSHLAQYQGATFIIPNSKVIEAKGEAVRSRYLDFLTSSVTLAQAAGHRVVILVHEGAGDEKLAHALNDQLPERVDVITNLTALETKGLITGARAIISSRFHGLVSGLSSGVPSLACGWSHKYKELAHDYGCDNWVVDLDKEAAPAEKVKSFLAEETDPQLRSQLVEKAQAQKELSRETWRRIYDVIDGA